MRSRAETGQCRRADCIVCEPVRCDRVESARAAAEESHKRGTRPGGIIAQVDVAAGEVRHLQLVVIAARETGRCGPFRHEIVNCALVDVHRHPHAADIIDAVVDPKLGAYLAVRRHVVLELQWGRASEHR